MQGSRGNSITNVTPRGLRGGRGGAGGRGRGGRGRGAPRGRGAFKINRGEVVVTVNNKYF